MDWFGARREEGCPIQQGQGIGNVTDSGNNRPLVGTGIFIAPLTHQVLGAVPSWLLACQTFRIIGINLLMGYFNGTLPALFALPIGVGDVVVGIAAPFVAYGYAKKKLWGRSAAIWFNVIGVLDIAFFRICGSVEPE
jgi:hypothetical protein